MGELKAAYALEKFGGAAQSYARLHSPRGIDAVSHHCVALQKTE